MSTTTTPKACASCALLTWKNPAKTGPIFAALIAGLLATKYLNLVNIFFFVASYGLAASAAAEYAGKKVTGQGFVTKYVPQSVVKTSIARQFNDQYLPHIAVQLEKFETEAKKIVLGTNFECTIKTAVASYLLYKITSWFSLFTLALTAVVGAFTLPVIYESNKTEIDALVAKYYKVAHKQACDLAKTAQKSVKPHLKTVSEKLSPVTQFVQSKLPNHRTAGSTVADKKPIANEKIVVSPVVAEPVAVKTSGVEFPSVPSSIQEVKETVHEIQPEVQTPVHANLNEAVEAAKKDIYES
ncbi:hypothetical protein BABINDRAFT_169747 [Babjeviella inositovora NRRL Y-12698]|uniref:Reticulon-like protein n=1 Tax=Babjeviella inositovora NRRL Y-12698 TaxID=984486 RepID=A0A1E3QZB4_9ASCO|nr:uncharacterized protein BABINDRAFT_169747 [Babjeviella inositovora NRRL Y-12698]ODQ82422.1 hypothetical protein BABINDRAFT_169747 [Babjeviella inositovora NRRL Y-12698]